MLILDKLWNGELNPAGRHIRSSPAYSEAMGMVNQAERSLLNVLSPEARALWEEYSNCRGTLNGLLEQDAFFAGFRMAGLMLLDILIEHSLDHP